MYNSGIEYLKSLQNEDIKILAETLHEEVSTNYKQMEGLSEYNCLDADEFFKLLATSVRLCSKYIIIVYMQNITCTKNTYHIYDT